MRRLRARSLPRYYRVMPPKNLPGSPAPAQKGPLSFKTTPSPRPGVPLGASGGKSAKAVGFFAMFALFAAIIWFLFGGDSSDNKKNNEGEVPAATTTLVSKVAVPITPITPEEIPPSLYAGWATLSAGTAAKDVYPEKEYVVVSITQKNLSSVDISGWTLKNTSGMSAALGLQAGVKGGNKLVISTGKSPTGASFQLNKCSGYLEQFLDFIPEIPRKCPTPSSLASYKTLEKSCQTFIKTIPPCETNRKEYPTELSGTCRYYIGTNVGYNACVANNKNNEDFYSTEWRIYLNRSEELWAAAGEAIMLLDSEGKLIASVKY